MTGCTKSNLTLNIIESFSCCKLNLIIMSSRHHKVQHSVQWVCTGVILAVAVATQWLYSHWLAGCIHVCCVFCYRRRYFTTSSRLSAGCLTRTMSLLRSMPSFRDAKTLSRSVRGLQSVLLSARALPNILFVFCSGRILGQIMYSYSAE